jgi:hypothetical protein
MREGASIKSKAAPPLPYASRTTLDDQSSEGSKEKGMKKVLNSAWFRSLSCGVFLLYALIAIALPLAAQTIFDSAGTVPRFTVGASPVSAAFYGENMWVVNNGSNSLTKLKSDDGALVGTYPCEIALALGHSCNPPLSFLRASP